MKLTKLQLKKIIKEEIQKLKKRPKIVQVKRKGLSEGPAALPGNIKRFMQKFIDQLKGSGLNRNKQMAVLAAVIDGMDIQPNKLMGLVQKVKAGMGIDDGVIKESTDTFDYNEIAIEQLQDGVNADAKAWMGTNSIMENDKTRDMVDHARKNGIEKIMRKLDRVLRKL